MAHDPVITTPAKPAKLEDQIREACRVRHYITQQDGTRADVIELALVKAYKLKEPK